MKIKMQLKDIIKSDHLINDCGLNPYCVNEGADGDDWMVVNVNSNTINSIRAILEEK